MSAPAPAPPGKPAPRQRRPYTPRLPAEARRDQVLDAALQIIARDGYGAVSVESIAREIDVTRPVVYNVFDGLEPLLKALLDRQQQRALDQLLRTISIEPNPPDPRAYLARTITDLVAMVAGDPLTWAPIFVTSSDTPAAVRNRITRSREQVRQRIEIAVGMLSATRPAGEPVDAEMASHALVAIGEYFGRMILEQPDAVDAERLAAMITTLLLPGHGRAPSC